MAFELLPSDTITDPEKQIDNNVVLAENAMKIVEKKFRNPELSVESICGELHVSTSYFSKIFKQETGGTFINYLISRRMEEAKNCFCRLIIRVRPSERW